MNHGLLKEPISLDDYILGADRSIENRFGAEVLQPDGNWGDYLPESEKQAPGYETSACVTFGTLTCGIEILAKRQYGLALNLSDRFAAKLSGTDPKRGNSPKKVAQFVRDNWSVLEYEWATHDARNADEFYADIPKNLTALAHARGAEFEFAYEWVHSSKSAIKQALKYSPVCISVPAWYEDEDGKYYRPDDVEDGHWTVCYDINDKGEWLIEDTYAPFRKIMRADFLPEMAMRYHLKKRPEPTLTPFARFVQLIRQLIGL